MMLESQIINQSMLERMRPLKAKKSPDSLLVHEIYASIQGESSFMGMPCVFVRTTGCHLRCRYCDTEHAFFRGEEKSIEEILDIVMSLGINLVELTGGEPLLQSASFVLMDKLIERNFTVLIETSGAVSIKNINRQVKVILDIKTPASGESHKNVMDNLLLLWPGCEVKFVISDHNDYEYAKQICQSYNLYERTHVLFSPVVALFDPKELVDLILADKLPIRFQMQLHRVLYGETPGK